MFVPYTITGGFERGILVRTHGDPEALLNSVRREIWAVDRNVALTIIGSLTELPAAVLLRRAALQPDPARRLRGVGLVLVAIGVYSVIAYTVSRQTHEIGIRMALGASRGDVLRMVALMGLRLVAIGAVIGLLASFAATKVLARQLWNVSRFDPLTLVDRRRADGVVGLAACYFPARRAMRVDPMVALQRIGARRLLRSGHYRTR